MRESKRTTHNHKLDSRFRGNDEDARENNDDVLGNDDKVKGLTGVLLINLGTPDSPSTKHVRSYLREFLSDPYVIDIHPVIRWLLLNFIILPTRPKKSAEAYRKIWHPKKGSPLLFHSVALAEHAQTLLGENYKVVLGKRYGKPTIKNAVAELRDCERIIVLPLFPQYSLAATETAIQKAMGYVTPHWHDTQITVIRDFYSEPTFIQAQAGLIQQAMQAVPNEDRKIIFSYHGLPERQITKACDCRKVCNMQQTCPAINLENRDCYRAQCYATSRALQHALQLNDDDCITSFQSRLGRIPWIKPYTDEVLTELAQQGIKHLVVACPSFVCDCLETLEEIGIRAKEQWLAEGGESLTLVPCVNDDANWVRECIILRAQT
jgi:ferrochelatase